MSTDVDAQHVDKRLMALHQRHRETPLPSGSQFYEPGSGYHRISEASDPPDQFGIALAGVDGETASVGDDEVPFALQSLSKVFAYGLALKSHGREGVLRHVGVEPSGDAFNSISFDERHVRPHNPMVNAGAMVTSDLVSGDGPAEKIGQLLACLREYSGNDELKVDPETLEGEFAVADRNRAIAYLMRAQGMIEGDVNETLEVYLSQCSVKVTCRDLALMAATLANGGVNPATGRTCLPRERVRDLLSVMYTCGMYDFAGEWAYEIGLPAKSGVSGGILCVVPGKLGIAVLAPGLDEYGNSVRGVNVCHEISENLGLHVFATEDEYEVMGPFGDAQGVVDGSGG